ncbi:RluA family pseudouridine synthase [Kosmotoga pacifica]|uniref:Pseudouridine synthase n=1 Tax=Kosmotoga pacifica TaxID=1330330 RepID=A0A0G2ZCN1_9BACT|nr:RluA family pseudouridine synthase [Kosmotoga pacifica]AKI97856.1 pseudouridine synthase [Kosmotoga pacifica]
MLEEIVVTNRENGWRLDRFVTEIAPPWVSRSAIQRHIKEGKVLVNGSMKKPGYKVKSGDLVSFEMPKKPVDVEAQPEDIPLNIIYEDRDIIVVNKPAGMIVHPVHNKKSGTLVNALLNHCGDLQGIGGVLRPGIVHRLDKETSGIIVVAKNDLAHNSLSLQFKARSTEKIYVAIARGKTPIEGQVVLPLGRHPVNRLKMTVVFDGKEATTFYRTLRYYSDIASFLLIRPKTGRTHQIRVHMKEIGHPLIGDKLYGKAHQDEVLGAYRHMLHALKLSFNHPRTNERMSFVARIPEDMARVLKNLSEFREDQP